jgi:hypothetical protein
MRSIVEDVSLELVLGSGLEPPEYELFCRKFGTEEINDFNYVVIPYRREVLF